MDDRRFSPRELLTASNWSSLLFTTYSLSLSFVEAVPLSAVSRSFKNFTVLADLEGYLSSLSDVGAIGVGRDYDLVPIRVSGGVFHPKISVLADETGNIRATVGSGNLSFGGWGYNNEVIELLRPGRDSRCFADIAAMLEAMSKETMPGGKFECLRSPNLDHFIDIAKRAATTPGESRSRMLHTLAGPLVPQIKEMADDLGGARSLTVVSPFFSAHNGVQVLATGLGCGDVSVAVPLVAPSIFDFKAAAAAGIVIRPVTCGYFEDNRSLHSKLFDIVCERGRLIVTGSANATTAALLGRNVEAVVVRPTDLALSFGWRSTSRYDSRTTGEREPLESSGAGLVVDYNSGLIVGRVMGPSAVGDWEALVSSGTRRHSAGIVKVGQDGYFRFQPPVSKDPISLGSAAQVIFIRGDVELRGWLVMRDIIRAIAQRGPIARSISRIVSGLDTLGDVGAILNYFARDPKVLFEASERSGGGRADRKNAVRTVSGDVSVLRGTSALDMASTWSGSDAGHSGDALIEALVRHLASATPSLNDDSADDDDEDDDAPLRDGPNTQRGRPQKRGQKLQKPIVESAFEQLFSKLEMLSPGSERAPALFVVFDMMIQIVPRTEASDELMSLLIQRWIRASANARPTDTDPTALDQCLSIVAARLVIEDPSLAPCMHAAIQAWVGGELDDDFRLLFEPDATGLEERRIYPGGLTEEWKQAWAQIVSSRTRWSVMNELRRSILAGEEIAVPEGASQDETTVLKKVVDGTGRPDKVAYLTFRRAGRQACPKCYNVLPAVQQSRLKKGRIATCGNFRCNRVVVDVSL